VHRVYAGQTLGRIAKRYNVSISSICNANGLPQAAAIRPGQALIIPARTDENGSQALAARKRGEFTKQGVDRGPDDSNTAAKPEPRRESPTRQKRPTAARSTPKVEKPSWHQYRKPARRPGRVTLKATGRGWSGYAIVKGNRISSKGHDGFKYALYSWRSGDERQVDGRLIRLLVQISDTFGGRPLRIVSGFREKSHEKDSKHKHGQACDFSIPGVPNSALRDYLATLDGVGVGYYPNSSFVHLDVRDSNTQWVDAAGPGQPPQYAHTGGGSSDSRAD
jgi:hypothetical protein